VDTVDLAEEGAIGDLVGGFVVGAILNVVVSVALGAIVRSGQFPRIQS
jgi:hypothetical protein